MVSKMGLEEIWAEVKLYEYQVIKGVRTNTVT
jgi:hypothetical protein